MEKKFTRPIFLTLFKKKFFQYTTKFGLERAMSVCSKMTIQKGLMIYLFVFFWVLSANLLNGQTVIDATLTPFSCTTPGDTQIEVPCGASVEVTYMIWGGGGAGGGINDGNRLRAAAGGGGGGYSTGTIIIGGGIYTLTCGAGGVNASGLIGRGEAGEDSSVFGITADGGGGGSSGASGGNGGAGDIPGGAGGTRNSNGGGGGGGGSGPGATAGGNGTGGGSAAGGAGGTPGPGGDGGDPGVDGAGGNPGAGGGGKGSGGVALPMDNIPIAGVLMSGSGGDGQILLTFANYQDPGVICYPTSTECADLLPGDHFVNTGNCSIAAGDPDNIITVPTFDCSDAVAVTFDTPVFPTPEILYHYWGNCAPLSPRMPDDIHPRSNGFIQQMFCATDAFGLPAFSGGLSGETGVIDFLPEKSADVGCNGFAEVGTCECGGDGASPGEKDTEIIQLDFWLAVPEVQNQVGFRFSTNSNQDAASFFVGPALGEMCEVAYFADGTVHDGLPDQLTGTYNIDNDIHSGECGVLWMRVRIYINDINDQFEVNPQLNAGDGWVDISQLFTIPATSALDNTPPAVPTQTATGYFVDDMFFFDDGGVWDGFGCNPIVTATDPGECPPANPSIALSKNNLGPDSQTVVPGTDVDFTITVVNNGDENLCSVVMTDAMCDILTGPVGDGGVAGMMEVGETWTYICTVNNATATYTNTAMVTAQGCASTAPVMFEDPSEVVVCVAPELATAATPAICAGATFDLTTIVVTDAQAGNYPMGATVTTTYHTAIPANAINVVASTMVTPAATTTYYIVYTNDSGTPGDTADDCSDELAVTVTVNACGSCVTPDLSTAATPEICSGVAFDLATIVVTDAEAGNYPAGAIVTTTYHTATPANAVNVVAGTMVSPTSTTIYYILYTNDNGTPGDDSDDCFDEVDVTVTVNANPTLVTIDTTVCSGIMVDVTASVFSTGSPVGGDFSYHGSAADATNDATPLTGAAITEVSISGKLYVRYELSTGCFDTDSIELTVNDNPTLMTIDTAVCSGTMVDVTANIFSTGSPAGGDFSYHGSAGDATNDANPLTGTAITEVSTSGKIYVRYELTTTTGCFDTDSIEVTINDNPICSIIGAIIALENAQDIQYMGPAGMTYAWSVIAGDADIDGVSDEQNVRIDFGTSNSTLQLTITDGNGCTSTCTLDVTMTSPPLNCTISGPTNICTNTTGLTFSGIAGATSHAWTISTGDATIVGAANETTVTVNAGATDFTIQLVISPGGVTTCTETVTVNPLPICSIIGSEMAVENAQDVQYTGPAGMTSYAWSVIAGDAVIDGVSDVQNVNIDFGTSNSTLQLTIIDGNGCEATCTINITLQSAPNYTWTFLDPCNCANPDNITLSDGTFLFKDHIRVDASEYTDPMVSLFSADVNFLDKSGVPIDATTARFVPIGGGFFILPYYTRTEVPGSFVIEVNGDQQGGTSITCSPCRPTIPTLSQWGLIIFGLLILNLGIFFLYRKEGMLYA